MSSSKKTKRASFNHIKPIQVPLSAKWGIRVAGPEMIKLMYGFVPRDMDDKWACCTDGPDKEGNVRVRMCRSWSSMERVALIGRVPAEGHNNEKVIEREGGVISEIIWEKPQKDEYEPMDEKGAKEFAVGFSKSLMNCDLKG
jgi:hypothetical protein